MEKQVPGEMSLDRLIPSFKHTEPVQLFYEAGTPLHLLEANKRVIYESAAMNSNKFMTFTSHLLPVDRNPALNSNLGCVACHDTDNQAAGSDARRRRGSEAPRQISEGW